MVIEVIEVLTVDQVVPLHVLGHWHPTHGIGLDGLLRVFLELLGCQLASDRTNVHEDVCEVRVEGLLIDFRLFLQPLLIEVCEVDRLVMQQAVVEAAPKLHVLYLVRLIELILE